MLFLTQLTLSRHVLITPSNLVIKLITGHSISKALAMIPEDWDWDYFKANGQWRCRSIKTGRFAENYNCRNDPKDDDRWPNN